MSHPVNKPSHPAPRNVQTSPRRYNNGEERVYERKYRETKLKLRRLKDSYTKLQLELAEAKRAIARLNARRIVLLTQLGVADKLRASEGSASSPIKRGTILNGAKLNFLGVDPADAQVKPSPKKKAPSVKASQKETGQERLGTSLKPITRIKAPPQSKVAYLMPRDSEGHYTLPLTVGKFTVVALGTIDPHNPNFHNERYIWPVGFTVQRYYYSTVHPNRHALYTAQVLCEDGHPQFRITASDDPTPITGRTASGAWATLIGRANAARGLDRKSTASGPESYGIADPTIAKMIQDLPNAHLCANYAWQTFELVPPKKNPRLALDHPTPPARFNGPPDPHAPSEPPANPYQPKGASSPSQGSASRKPRLDTACESVDELILNLVDPNPPKVTTDSAP